MEITNHRTGPNVRDFALQDPHPHPLLVVDIRREPLADLVGNRRVPRNHDVVDLAGAVARIGHLDAQRVRVHIGRRDRPQPLDHRLPQPAFAPRLAGLQDRRVNARPLRDRFIGVQFPRRRSAGDFGQHLEDRRHVGRAPHQHHIVELANLDPRLLQHQFGGVPRPLQQIGGHPLEIAAGNRQRQRLPLVVQVHRDLRLLAQLPLRLFTLLREQQLRLGVGQRVAAVLPAELLGHMLDNAVRPVDTPQHHVAVGRQHPEVGRSVAHDRHVERTTPQVVNHDGLFDLLQVGPTQLPLHPGVRQGGRGRLVDDVNHVQPGDATGVLRRLPPHVVEVIWHGDDRVGDRPNPRLAILLELLQDQRRDKLGGQLLPLVFLEPRLVAHLPLDGVDDVFGRLDGDPLRAGPHHHMPRFPQQHNRRGRGAVVGVGDRDGTSVGVQLRQGRKRRPQVDANRLTVLQLHHRMHPDVSGNPQATPATGPALCPPRSGCCKRLPLRGL